jgi:hypothetical protein
MVEMAVEFVNTPYALIGVFTPTLKRLSVKRLILRA